MTSTEHKPTDQQQAFLNALCGTDGHLCLRARAGTGKTSTILMGVDAYVAYTRAKQTLIFVS